MIKKERQKLSLLEWFLYLILIIFAWLTLGRRLTAAFTYLIARCGFCLSPLLFYVNQHLHFLVLFALLLLFIYKVLNGSLRSYLSDAPRFRWNLFFLAFLVWLVALTALVLITLIFVPGSVKLVRPQNLLNRLIFMVIALVITPIQCLAEELLFRSSLWQMFKASVKNRVLLSLISALFFALFHLSNLEVTSANFRIGVILYYFLVGFCFMLMNSLHKGTEGALGAHIANNLFLALIVNYQNSSLISDAWFILTKTTTWADYLLLIICALIVIRYGARIIYAEE
ncbi:MAG: CPBP family intramembrane glutamic endopeptidase [Sphaerochaetaceae bacterium]